MYFSILPNQILIHLLLASQKKRRSQHCLIRDDTEMCSQSSETAHPGDTNEIKNKTAQIIQQCTIRKIVFPTDPKTQLVSCCSIRCQGNSVGWYLAKKLVLFLLTMLLDCTTEAENDICKEPLKSS